ncbi:acetyltransferase [Myxococcota bacterium]|nr:acetyltransferase [Myxococcota bacterium]
MKNLESSEIIFWGGTGQSRVLRELFLQLGCHAPRLVALVDNRVIPSPFQDMPNLPILHGQRGLEAWLRQRAEDQKYTSHTAPLFFCVAIGGGHGKARLSISLQLRALGLLPFSAIHPYAFVALDAQIGEGCQMMAKASLCTCARIGDYTILNTASSVDHDCVIGAGVHIAPGATLAGEVVVGDHAFIGAGATILPRIQIGEDAVVGAGAVVTKDVAPRCVVVGVPARPVVGR